jgi:hypothetical protein
LPDSPLECRPPYIKRQIETSSRRLYKAHHLSKELLELFISFNKICLRKSGLQITHQLLWLVAHKNGADSTVASGNKDRPQRGFSYCKADPCINSAGTKIIACHIETLIWSYEKLSV